MTAYMFNMPYHGHINPCLALIQELTRRGERIVFYGLEQYRRPAEAAGAVFRAFEYEEEETNVALCMMAEWQMQIVEKTLDGLIRDAIREKPSCVLVDYTCLWGRFLSQHLGLPAAVIHTTYPILTRRSRFMYLVAREVLRIPGIWRKVLSFRATARRLSRRWHVPRLAMPFELLYADYGELHLVLTSREMAPGAHRLDDRFAFVGPCIRPAGIAGGEPLPPLDEKPLLYVSLGTHWKHSGEIYRVCIDAFRDAPLQVLISGSERMPRELLQGLPSNFHVRRHVDQIEALSRANAFITQGGMNSVCEALVAGVPMLVHPRGFDQFSQARYIEGAGCGFALKPADLNRENLRRLVERLLRDRPIRDNCQRIGQQLLSLGGAQKAADLAMALRKPREGLGAEAPALARIA